MWGKYNIPSGDLSEFYKLYHQKVFLNKRDEYLVEKLTTRFSELTREAIVECPFVKGAKDFLEHIRAMFAVYLLSATPHSDLELILEARGLNDYFKTYCGAPIKKTETLKKIMMKEKASANEILFIGDSPEDQQSAKDLGIFFIGRKSDRDLNDTIHPVFKDFIPIKSYLNLNFAIK